MVVQMGNSNTLETEAGGLEGHSYPELKQQDLVSKSLFSSQTHTIDIA